MKGILLTILTLLLPLSLAAKATDKANVSLADSLAVVDKALAAYQQPAENDVHYVELLYRKTCLLNEMGHFADALPVAIQLLDIATPDLVGEDGMAVLLSQAAELSFFCRKLPQAITYEVRALHIIAELYGEESDEYLEEAPYLQKYFEENGQHDKAQQLARKLEKLLK